MDMENQNEPTLIARLCLVAADWAKANDVKVSRLGRLVVNDGGAIQRLESGGDLGTANLGKFTRFLASSANWPSGEAPSAAIELDGDVRREVSA